jgi:hypothetical protein
MEMGLLAAGRHAFGPRVDNEWLIGLDNYWPDNATPASASLSDRRTNRFEFRLDSHSWVDE